MAASLPNKKASHITDLLVARGVPQSAWGQLLPPEMLVGLKMNINRPFGNGRDDTNNPGIVDAPAVPASPKQVTLSGQTVNVNYDGTGTLATNPFLGRQLEARYLYVLMCLTCDLTYLNGPTAFNDATGATTARFIAQWAINAVDFKSAIRL